MTAPVFANSAFVRAPERLVMRGGAWRMLDIKVRYGLWRHERIGTMLIDTGYGPRVMHGAERGIALKIYAALFGPRLVEAGSIAAQLAARGLTRGDVGAVMVTHFHADHVAGLRDFPNARFIASGVTFDALRAMPPRQRLRNGIFMELLPDDFESRLIRVEDQRQAELPLGLGTGYDLLGDGSLLAVALPGHAIGHFGLVWPQLPTPLLYAVDTQWLWRAIAEDRPPSGPARLIFEDWSATLETIAKVRRFAAAGGEVVLCHEPGVQARDA